jgi:tetratricopeptide (TPR) repeat protein
LALVYSNQGLDAKAEPLFKRVLEIQEKHFDTNQLAVADTLNDLGVAYLNQNQYAKAEPLFLRSMAISEKTLGPNHPDIVASLNNLGALYAQQEQYEQAEAFFKRAVDIGQKALEGSKPLDLAVSLYGLATVYHAQKRYAQAEPLLVRALAIRERSLGSDHPDTMEILNNLVALYQSQGESAKAEPLLKRLQATQEKRVDKDRPDLAENLDIDKPASISTLTDKDATTNKEDKKAEPSSQLINDNHAAVEKATNAYLDNLIHGDFKSVYALNPQSFKDVVPFDKFVEQLTKTPFLTSGQLTKRRILKVEIDKENSKDNKPVWSVVVALNYEKLDVECGFLFWRQRSDGSFLLESASWLSLTREFALSQGFSEARFDEVMNGNGCANRKIINLDRGAP